MGLETGNFIGDLVSTNPTGSDGKSQGDDHLRLIKSTVLNSFTGFDGAVIVTGIDGGVSDIYTLTPTPSLPSYAARMVVVFSPTTSNTGASTINISNLGAKPVKSVAGVDLIANDLSVGQIYSAVYTGTEFRLLSITKTYADQLAFGGSLPGQAGNSGKLITTNGVSASWTDTFTIAINEKKGLAIPSASNINLTTATGNYVHVTGGNTINTITIPDGAERTVVFDSSLTLTSSVNIILPSNANIVTSAGDTAKFRGESGAAKVVSYEKANGRALIESTYALSFLGSISTTAVANIDFLSIFNSTYDDYLIILDGIRPSSNDSLNMRFANGGVVDSGSNYANQNSPPNSNSLFGVTGTADNGYDISSSFFIRNVNSTFNKTWSGIVAAKSPGGNWSAAVNGGIYSPSTVVSGIRLYFNLGSTFQVGGTVKVYGISKQ